jgi:hypothetical protein
LDGNSCVLLSVAQQSGVNTANVAKAVSAQMAELAAKNPSLQYSIVMDQSDFIDLSVRNTIQNIIFGVLFAAIVLFLFLRDLGATAVIAISMPVCSIQVFLIMQVFDITLNMLSLGGIAMGVGMIVDNSIVVLENIFRFRADGKERLEACVEGAAEVTLPVIASTLTTVVVFLPIGLSSGLSGQLFRDFTPDYRLSSAQLASDLADACAAALLYSARSRPKPGPPPDDCQSYANQTSPHGTLPRRDFLPDQQAKGWRYCIRSSVYPVSCACLRRRCGTDPHHGSGQHHRQCEYAARQRVGGNRADFGPRRRHRTE